jgi:hypothetical protein
VNNIQELRRQGLSICAIDTMTGFDRKSVHPYWLIESDSRVTVRVQARGLPSLVFCGLVIFSRAGNEKEKKPERNVSVESIERRMEELANEQLPDSHRSNFWTSEMDKILMAGARRGLESERKAIQKVLAMRPDLRRGTIRQRQRVLARRIPIGKSHRGRKYGWTAELDDRLQRAVADLAVKQLSANCRKPRVGLVWPSIAAATSSAFQSSDSIIKVTGAPSIGRIL